MSECCIICQWIQKHVSPFKPLRMGLKEINRKVLLIQMMELLARLLAEFSEMEKKKSILVPTMRTRNFRS